MLRERWFVVTASNLKEYLSGDDWLMPDSFEPISGEDLQALILNGKSHLPVFAFDALQLNFVYLKSWNCVACGKDTSVMNDCGGHRLVDVTPFDYGEPGSGRELLTRYVQWACGDCVTKVGACIVCGAGIYNGEKCMHCAPCHELVCDSEQLEQRMNWHVGGWHDSNDAHDIGGDDLVEGVPA